MKQMTRILNYLYSLQRSEEQRQPAWLHRSRSIGSLQEETRGVKCECGLLPLCCYYCCNAALTSGGVGGGGGGVGAGGYPSLDG